MAGIGFELKKLFRSDLLLDKIRGISYATLVSIGPMIISISMIVILNQILMAMHTPLQDREFVVSTIMYAYVFAMINVSGFVMIISRYIADKIYIKDFQDVLASLVGVIAITVLTGGIAGFVFFLGSPLPVLIKFASYCLLIELSILFILMAYVSALKDYKRIAVSYGIGVVLTILGSILLILAKVSAPVAVLVSFALSFLITIFRLLATIRRSFSHMSDNLFDFLVYVKKMPLLFFTNLCYTLTLFVHNFIFWRFSNLAVEMKGTYLYAPAYDSATFLAVLTIIPITVMFVVKGETSIYDQYRNFCQMIANGATLKLIGTAKTQMNEVIRKELSFIFEVQLIITVLLIIFGINVFLPLLGSSTLTKELFVLMAIAYFLTYMTYMVITLLLYFDNQEATFAITSFFLLATIIFTGITLRLGERYYGLGLIASALISLLIGLYVLEKTVNQIDYRMFSKQPYIITHLPVPKDASVSLPDKEKHE